MKSRQLQSNDDLSNFLCRLGGELRSLGELDLANAVERASRFASGSASEFLHEAQEALREVRRKQLTSLNEVQNKEIISAVQQIEVAFLKVGGA
jgi:hypothetical protein